MNILESKKLIFALNKYSGFLEKLIIVLNVYSGFLNK